MRNPVSDVTHRLLCRFVASEAAMLDDQAFNKLVDEIIAQGVDDITATHYAALIGDTPIVDERFKGE